MRSARLASAKPTQLTEDLSQAVSPPSYRRKCPGKSGRPGNESPTLSSARPWHIDTR